jgi:VanZ family protein
VGNRKVATDSELVTACRACLDAKPIGVGEMKCGGVDPSILTLPLVLISCSLLLTLSTFARPQFDAGFPVDKVGHFIIFAGLGVSVSRYFSKEFADSATLGVILTLLSCAFFGMCDEIYQSLIPGRSAELPDFVADCLGALSGGLVYLILLRRVCSRVSGKGL